MTFETLGYNSTDALGFIYPSRGEFHFPSMLLPYKWDPNHSHTMANYVQGRVEKKRKKKEEKRFLFSVRERHGNLITI
jgi:hypothetical protein